ncbi:MATE family efflux transporter [Winogradskyella undariae]|uniref:MATE family efflux transporter n=1 Tax=Winogradskyella undariae TaxID=1285465 RepID=UPI00156AF270|nr:MATE family efflux transporter [Winogradskyella undariae]NRR91562.1 MATE family efflux transporter [Winogradskyella undariae]QNK76726.1 MATE family efflux transporter [Winogradskyella sp. PAMC22761]
MAKVSSEELGNQPIGQLLIKQAVPASIGVLVMSLNVVVDTIFVGQWIGAIAIAAINIVLPVSFFIAALGMSVGVGGASIISRALGASNYEKALKTFGNQITLVLVLTTSIVALGLFFADDIILLFGGKGEIFAPAKVYYKIVLYGIPMLAFSMLGNNVIRAEGKPKFGMYAMMIPSIGNLLLDYIFINLLGYGMAGAAWATTISYSCSFLFVVWFFNSKHSELKISLSHFGLDLSIVKEIAALGFVTLARQAVVSVTYLFMNNILFNLGGATSVTAYAIVGRMLMFALFPVLGVTQGFLPIAGFNYGAKNYERVRESINIAIKYAAILASVIFVVLMLFPEAITRVFTSDLDVIRQTPSAMRWVFAATPIIALQLIGAAYFQAIGKATPALLLTLSRQGFFFIPLILILPKFYGEIGVWMSFPIADVLATIVTGYFLNREIRKNLINKIV